MWGVESSYGRQGDNYHSDYGRGLELNCQVVRGAGLEPARYFYHEPLKLACLPVPPPAHLGPMARELPTRLVLSGGRGRIRRRMGWRHWLYRRRPTIFARRRAMRRYPRRTFENAA